MDNLLEKKKLRLNSGSGYSFVVGRSTGTRNRLCNCLITRGLEGRDFRAEFSAASLKPSKPPECSTPVRNISALNSARPLHLHLYLKTAGAERVKALVRPSAATWRPVANPYVANFTRHDGK